MLLTGAEYWDGESEAHQNLAYFVDSYVRERLDFGEEGGDNQPDYRQRLREYCSQGTPYQVLDRTFGDWLSLASAIAGVDELAEQCDPRQVSSYPQLINRVLHALGFFDIEAPFSLARENSKVDGTLSLLTDNKLEALGDARDCLLTAERVLKLLWLFYTGYLFDPENRRKEEVLRFVTVKRKMQFGDWVSRLVSLNKAVLNDEFAGLKERFQNTFGREAVFRSDWERELRLMAALRVPFVHTDGLEQKRWKDEVWAVVEADLDPSQRNFFRAERLNVESDKIILDRLQLKILAVAALRALRRFYAELLGQGIFPRIVVHERAEVDSQGRITVFFVDEDGVPGHVTYEPRKITNVFDVFCPHPTAPQAFYYYDETNHRPAGGPIVLSIWEHLGNPSTRIRE